MAYETAEGDIMKVFLPFLLKLKNFFCRKFDKKNFPFLFFQLPPRDIHDRLVNARLIHCAYMQAGKKTLSVLFLWHPLDN